MKMLLPLPRPGLEATIAAYAPIGGMVLRFSGCREFVAIPNAEAINFQRDQSYTVECWVRPEKVQPFTAARDNDVVEKWSGTGGYPYVIRYLNQTGGANAGRVVAARWDGRQSTSVLSAGRIDDGEFHHVAMVFTAGSPGQLSLFIDGRPAGGPVDDLTSGATDNDSPLFLARRGEDAPHPNYFAGDLGRVRVWKGALTQREIEATMHATYFGPYEFHHADGTVGARLVGNWRCDEGYGDLAYDYSGGRDAGRLGGGRDDQAPVWVVSTILPRYDVVQGLASTRGEKGDGA